MKRTEKFKIGELFRKISTVKISGKANDFPDKSSDGYTIPLLTAGIEHQGLARYAKPEQCPTILHNAISISANGANSGATFYQSTDFAVLQDAYAITLINRDIANEREGLYLAGALNKAISGNHDWMNKAGWTNIKDDTISLPILTAPDLSPVIDPMHAYSSQGFIPDFAYMEHYIAELEAKRVAELEAYLRAADLNDYELTEDDKEVLEKEEKGEIRKKEFKLGELFEIHPTNAYKLINSDLYSEQGTTPILSNSSMNNGIGGYIGLEPTEQGHILTFSDTTTGADTLFYQSQPFIGYAHVQGMYPKCDKWSELSYMYLIPLIRKAAGNGFSYAVKFNRTLVAKLTISLPIDSEGNIYFAFMEKYIKAIEKLSIAGVVRYKDRVIEETKKLIA